MKAQKELKKDIFIISVTDITSKKRPKNKRYLVETNLDSYKFDEDTVIKYMLFKDHEFTKKEFDEVLFNALVSEGFNKALSYLARSKKSTYEVKEYLRKKDSYNETAIEAIVTKLKEFKFLDDYEYARSVINTYGKVKGPLYIKNKLEVKRIHKNIISKVLSEYSKDFSEFENAYSLARKVMEASDIKKYPISKQKTKVYSKLISNGFSSEVSSTVILRIEFVDESDEELEKDLRKYLRKYFDSELSFKEKKNKIITSLMNKGYNYKNINKIYQKVISEE